MSDTHPPGAWMKMVWCVSDHHITWNEEGWAPLVVAGSEVLHSQLTMRSPYTFQSVIDFCFDKPMILTPRMKRPGCEHCLHLRKPRYLVSCQDGSHSVLC